MYKLLKVKNRYCVISTDDETKYLDRFVDLTHDSIYINENSGITINSETFPNIKKVVAEIDDLDEVIVGESKEKLEQMLSTGMDIYVKKINEFTDHSEYQNVGWGDGEPKYKVILN